MQCLVKAKKRLLHSWEWWSTYLLIEAFFLRQVINHVLNGTATLCLLFFLNSFADTTVQKLLPIFTCILRTIIIIIINNNIIIGSATNQMFLMATSVVLGAITKWMNAHLEWKWKQKTVCLPTNKNEWGLVCLFQLKEDDPVVVATNVQKIAACKSFNWIAPLYWITLTWALLLKSKSSVSFARAANWKRAPVLLGEGG